MSNRWLHTFDSISNLNDYITSDYEEPFVALTEDYQVNFNIRATFDNNGYEYIDLGLPSGTLWATKNVGSENPESIGSYFAFAEVTPKEDYQQSNYKYYSSGTYTKYNSTDNLSKLELQDDAANYNWGGDWCMPTREQIDELYRNTTMTETTVNGKDVYKFEASNGNFIIFPKSGYAKYGYDYHGYYLLLWTSNIVGTHQPSDWWLKYSNGGPTNYYKYNGLNCRPVILPTRKPIVEPQ